MVVSRRQGFLTHLEISGRPPIPVVCRLKPGFRSDGSMTLEGEADVEEDMTSSFGLCGRIVIGPGRPKVGIRIANADPGLGIVRFLIREDDEV